MTQANYFIDRELSRKSIYGGHGTPAPAVYRRLQDCPEFYQTNGMNGAGQKTMRRVKNLATGQVYGSIREAAREEECSDTLIVNCCNRGERFRFVD